MIRVRGHEDVMADFLRRNAAAKLALLEYKWFLMVIVFSITGIITLVSPVDSIIDRALLGLILGGIVAYFVKEIILSRLLLKKYDGKQLRKKWLAFGGFREED